MSFIDKLSAHLPFGKKEEESEYYFALNIASDELTAALWTIEGKELKILDTTSDKYSSQDEIGAVADRLLDAVLGIREIEPQKILFGVPNSWLSDDNLKDEYLKVLRKLVKDLQLTPMAYVATANALVHFLEKSEGVPPTAVLAGFEHNHLTVTVVRAGKLDGVKVVARGEISGVDLEKALLNFTSVGTLPSKILIYDSKTNLEKLKTQLLSYSWMSKLSFLHFPKIEILGEGIEIKSVCLAGASEVKADITYSDKPLDRVKQKHTEIIPEAETPTTETLVEGDNFGFVVGDVSDQVVEEEAPTEDLEGTEELAMSAGADTNMIESEDFESEVMPPSPSPKKSKLTFNLKRFIPTKLIKSPILLLPFLFIIGILALFIFIPKADVKIFVEPKILEKDAQVIADPSQKTVDENAKIIPGQIVETEVSGSAKDSASGKKEIGDSAKGTITIYNKTFDSVSLSKGTQITSKNGIKFTLDSTVNNIASASATVSGIVFGKPKISPSVTAIAIGADGNLSSSSEFTITGYSSDKLSAVAEGNFSGGTSKTVTVVSSDDQKRLLAKLSSDLRLMAQQKVQEKLKDQKILQEALTETITKKSYSKSVGDQASDFSLDMTASYKGTAFNDADLRLIVSKLITTQVPDGFVLDLSNTETQADVSSVDKSGKVIFLAKFKAKLIPKIDIEKVKMQIRGKSVKEVEDFVKGMENVLGAEVKITPNLPGILQRIPFIKSHISVEVGLK